MKNKATLIKRILIFDTVLALLTALYVFSIEPPEEIRDLSVINSTYNSVDLSWEETGNATAYRIYRAEDEDGEDFKYLGSTSETTYKDENLNTGTEYLYSVRPAHGIIKAKASEPVAVTPSLDKPSISGNIRDGKVELTVSEVDGAQGYKVYRNGKEIKKLTARQRTFVDEDADPDKDYKYEIKAYRNEAVSEPSNRLKLSLTPADEMTADIILDTLTLTWEAGEFDYYRLYQGNELLTETSECKYEMEVGAGEYTFKLVGFSDDLQSLESVHKYAVSEEDMDNEDAIDAACAWAEKIAADDTFMYGTGDRAHRCGCYFCGTNSWKKGTSKYKGHSYEKTYCCNPFVHAAYSHGAGDPTMLEACQAGKSVGMTVKSYTRYGNWVKVGKPSIHNLQKGDVLVANPHMGKSHSNHVMLYIGDGNIAHAARSGWDPDSIRVNGLTSKNYKRCDFVMRYTGNGSGKMLTVTEIENDSDNGSTPNVVKLTE